MEHIVVIIICVIVILILKIILDIKYSNINKIKQIGYDKKLNEITNLLPDNISVCKDILSKLDNTGVNIQESSDSKKELTYYSVITNSIIIANISNTFTRIQTIAHECIHSIQNRKILLFNFIFSNFYLLYFLIVCILTITNIVNYKMLQIFVLLMLGFVYYMIRSYLENDAMTKAFYLAKEYIDESHKLSKEQSDIIIKNYKELNKIGIPMVNFKIMFSVILKVIIYCVIAIIV